MSSGFGPRSVRQGLVLGYGVASSSGPGLGASIACVQATKDKPYMANVSLANYQECQRKMWSRNGLKFVPKELNLSVPCVLEKEILLHTIWGSERPAKYDVFVFAWCAQQLTKWQIF